MHARKKILIILPVICRGTAKVRQVPKAEMEAGDSN